MNINDESLMRLKEARTLLGQAHKRIMDAKVDIAIEHSEYYSFLGVISEAQRRLWSWIEQAEIGRHNNDS